MAARTKILFLLGGAFLVLAPLSVATSTSLEDGAKYARVLVMMLMVLVGLLGIGSFKPRAATLTLLAFVAVFTGSALWSDSPIWGLFNKGMFALSCCSGIAVAYAPRDVDELKKGLKFLGLVASAVTLLVVAVYFRGAGVNVKHDRLSILGANANTVGAVAASLLILCVYLMLHAKKVLVRSLLLLECAVLAAVILGSGSRGGVLVSLIGCVMLALPFVKRPLPFIVAGLVMTAIVFGVMELVTLPGVERLNDELGKDTRSNIWKFALKKFNSSPVYGVGWLHWGPSWGTVQSIYLQTLVETGIIGAALLAQFAFVMMFKAKNLAQIAIARGPASDAASIVLAMTVSVLVHGVAESSPFVGTSVDSFLLGFGVGMADRMPAMAAMAKKRTGKTRYVLIPVGPPPRPRDDRQPARSA